MPSKKNWGWGSLSLILVIFAIVWCSNVQFWNGFCLGDYVLNLLDLPRWSNGTSGVHYTVFYGLLFLIPAWLLGRRKAQDKFAALGSRIAVILSMVLLLAPILIVV